MMHDESEKEWNGISIHHINNRKLKKDYSACLFEEIRLLLFILFNC